MSKGYELLESEARGNGMSLKGELPLLKAKAQPIGARLDQHTPKCSSERAIKGEMLIRLVQEGRRIVLKKSELRS
jgi:hypothetical protein